MNDALNPTPLTDQQIAALDEVFPVVDPGARPCGSRILVQLRSPKKKIGGVFIPESAQETEKWNTQVAKVISVGPLAFKHRDSQKDWAEGAWCKPGEYVRFNKYIGDRWDVVLDDDRTASFIVINDLEVTAVIYGDPLAVKAFL